jgi:hypothetical protein
LRRLVDIGWSLVGQKKLLLAYARRGVLRLRRFETITRLAQSCAPLSPPSYAISRPRSSSSGVVAEVG